MEIFVASSHRPWNAKMWSSVEVLGATELMP